jgi:phospholipid/cholesterol/gamma-HCH transport system ATP-binding protein
MIKDSLVSFVNVKKTFGENCVLNQLNLNIPKNKISFIIGRSGEGKSVALKHIIGVLRPDEGDLYIDGVAMREASFRVWQETRKKIGILFQDGALFDSLNVFDNVSFPIQNHTKKSFFEIKKEVKKLLELVDLPGIERKYPSELSIGEKKRVGLARALALQPKLLLYDEPTTSMDPLVSHLIDELICSTQQQMSEMTSVVVSHDVSSFLNVAQYIFLLHQGKIYFQGTPDDFRLNPDELVKQFLSGSRNGPLGIPII